MNRIGLGLAIGAGYLLGRTRKLKLAFAVGSLVAGKRLNLGPKALLDLANQQLRDNPQFKEIGDQLRHDLRGVGKAASGAMVERQVDALADRLHGRTAEVRNQLAGVVPAAGGLGLDGGRDDEDAEADNDEAEDAGADDEGARDERDPAEARQRKAPVKKAAKKVPAKTAAKKAPAKKAPAKKVAQGRAAAKKTAGRARPKGGGDR
ncbi:DNA primase [Streptomyces sp. FXJ1.172]|uniref:DNA primase n=1 Tax=Streptomyces sp. FXJ1.172 TaxID=710705 RepID=UPI0007D0148A|nr:DNA primase [Streptomyces sp. FXJ1.172]WEO93077.1 DNA primase [Streptomyces sp. FXJ1.172]